MSESPWKTDNAFDAMFDDTADYTTAKDGSCARVRCCAFPIEDIDPFAETDADSEIKKVTILVRKSEWNFNAKSPQIGDKVELTDDAEYRISEVNDEQNWWKLTGRSASC